MTWIIMVNNQCVLCTSKWRNQTLNEISSTIRFTMRDATGIPLYMELMPGSYSFYIWKYFEYLLLCRRFEPADVLYLISNRWCCYGIIKQIIVIYCETMDGINVMTFIIPYLHQLTPIIKESLTFEYLLPLICIKEEILCIQLGRKDHE